MTAATKSARKAAFDAKQQALALGLPIAEACKAAETAARATYRAIVPAPLTPEEEIRARFARNGELDAYARLYCRPAEEKAKLSALANRILG